MWLKEKIVFPSFTPLVFLALQIVLLHREHRFWLLDHLSPILQTTTCILGEQVESFNLQDHWSHVFSAIDQHWAFLAHSQVLKLLTLDTRGSCLLWRLNHMNRRLYEIGRCFETNGVCFFRPIRLRLVIWILVSDWRDLVCLFWDLRRKLWLNQLELH